MSEPVATDISVQIEVSTETQFELTPEWVAYLEGNDPPAMIAGIDPSISHAPNDSRMA